MPKVQLKVNMIYGGAFHRADTVLDEDEIPQNLRKRKYLKEPEPEEVEEPEEIEVGEVFFEDDEPPPPPRKLKPKRRLL